MKILHKNLDSTHIIFMNNKYYVLIIYVLLVTTFETDNLCYAIIISVLRDHRGEDPIQEIDINPLIIFAIGAVVVDATIVLV